MEVVIIIDTLRRAGWHVVPAGIAPGTVLCSRGVRITPDEEWEQARENHFDVLIIPGGAPGTKVLRSVETVLEKIRIHHARERLVAAICAGPLVLQEAGILAGRRITSHPAVAEQIVQAEWVDEAVVVDDHIITSQGPGTTFRFALELIARADGKVKADELATSMVMHHAWD
jgi:DJ-1 family protein